MTFIAVNCKIMDCEHSDVCFDLEGLPFNKRKLPLKIIQLRRTSQENHVRRMKTAQQINEMKGPFDSLSFLALPITKKNFSCLETTFSSNSDSVTKTAEPRTCRSSNEYRHSFSPKNLSNKCKDKHLTDKHHPPEELKINSSTNSAECDVDRTQLALNEGSQNISNKSGKQSKLGLKPKVSANKLPNEVTAHEKNSPKTFIDHAKATLDSVCKNFSNALQLNKQEESKKKNSQDSPDVHKSVENVDDRNAVARKQSSIRSKIPVSRSRLTVMEKNGKLVSVLSQTNFKSQNDNITPPSDKNNKQVVNLVDLKASPVQQNENYLPDDEIGNSSSSTITYAINKSSPCKSPRCSGTLNSLCSKIPYVTPNKISSTSNWLENSTFFGDRGKSSSANYQSPSFNICDACQSNDKHSQLEAAKNMISVSEDITKNSDASKSPIPPQSESNASLESYYETEEREYEDLLDQSKSENSNEKNLEDESTVSVPSDKDLDLDNHRESIFRNMPDYPNTPYYLRYPRYKSNESALRSAETEAGDGSTRKKLFKSRKKPCISTPRRKSATTLRNLKIKKTASKKNVLSYS